MEHIAGREGPPVAPAVLDHVLPRIGGMATVERLAALSGSDFTSVLLEVARRRAVRETPASVQRRYARDRFSRPGRTPWRSIRRAEDALLAALPGDVELLTLAPVVPLGTHSVLGTVSQHKVLTTIRACEVAADPTSALALEAAARLWGPVPGGDGQAGRRPARYPHPAVRQPGRGRALQPVRAGHGGP